MSTQNAIIVTEIGKPVVLDTRATPHPGPNQIQVRVTVAALNPHDGKSRDWGLFVAEKLPATLSNDTVGVVTALGSHVTKYKVGDRIFGQSAMSNDAKGLQQYAILDEAYTSRIPQGLTDHDVATIPTNFIAPLVALYDKTTLNIPAPWTEDAKSFNYAGTSILIIGGGSNCGRFGVQIAKLAKVGKIVVVGGDEAELKRYGATHVVDRHGGHDVVVKRVRDIVGDDLVLAFDAVNPPPGQALAIDALSKTKNGKLARLLPLGPVDDPRGHDVIDVLGLSQLKEELCAPFWEKIAEYLEQGKITPLSYTVVDGMNPDKINEVFDSYNAGGKVTQTHIRISE